MLLLWKVRESRLEQLQKYRFISLGTGHCKKDSVGIHAWNAHAVSTFRAYGDVICSGLNRLQFCRWHFCYWRLSRVYRAFSAYADVICSGFNRVQFCCRCFCYWRLRRVYRAFSPYICPYVSIYKLLN